MDMSVCVLVGWFLFGIFFVVEMSVLVVASFAQLFCWNLCYIKYCHSESCVVSDAKVGEEIGHPGEWI